jgi:hypothetical protein
VLLLQQQQLLLLLLLLLLPVLDQLGARTGVSSVRSTLCLRASITDSMMM